MEAHCQTARSIPGRARRNRSRLAAPDAQAGVAASPDGVGQAVSELGQAAGNEALRLLERKAVQDHRQHGDEERTSEPEAPERAMHEQGADRKEGGVGEPIETRQCDEPSEAGPRRDPGAGQVGEKKQKRDGYRPEKGRRVRRRGREAAGVRHFSTIGDTVLRYALEVIDVHCHILPGVDDGPPTLAESIAMCQSAVADGCEAVFATPHYNHPVWPNDDLALLDGKREDLARAVNGAPALLRGAEIRLTSSLLGDLDRRPKAQIPSLGGSRYLLLEFERGARPLVDPAGSIHELRAGGWFPILAHPEFVPWLHDDLDAVAALAARGALFQVTAMSVTGEFGPRAAAFCHELLAQGWARFVASDAHGVARRPPGLSRARAWVEERLSRETAEAIFVSNPAAVLADRPLPVPG